MIIFFAGEIQDNRALLLGDEARHCSKVLRKRVGDNVMFTDGKGFFYKGQIVNADKNNCEISILEKEKAEELPYKLSIAISPVKNPARFEWFVEKAVEIGIDSIIPLICKRTEKKNIKTARIENIIISASKQSLKAKFPVLKQPVAFNDFLESINPRNTFLAHLDKDAVYLGKIASHGDEIVLLIGPEGDFTTEEISKALGIGIRTVTLGSTRLRTETAGVVVCQLINTVYEMEK
jgi:16S rRNA (uracil1498-N3)-methyltransferase